MRFLPLQGRQCPGQQLLPPSLANVIAVAFPIPELAPVTSATLPSKLLVMFSYSDQPSFQIVHGWTD